MSGVWTLLAIAGVACLVALARVADARARRDRTPYRPRHGHG